jgi:GAF domain-containing protein
MTDYSLLLSQAHALTEGVKHTISNLANLSALLYDTLEDINWAGFYILEGSTLVLGPFQGRPACVEIPLGRGVCGTAAREDRTVVVPDVHTFPGHIACDSASRSEIVIPLRVSGRVWGVLDIDSPSPDRFDQSDREGLEKFALHAQTMIQ